ncbi:MAG TPA: hydrolase, partial [Gammaproteobacteria bacterium]|nr:hydrolase [Gammaproteobacteria bacterium]
MRSPHLQTLWPVLFKRRRPPGLRFERLELEDGDFLDLCWLEPSTRVGASIQTVLVLHGLEGNIDSHYARSIMHTLQAAGYRAVFMHFRGCSGEINRLPRAYHSGETGDLARVVEHIKTVTTAWPYAVIGYS